MSTPADQELRFSFGRNWLRYLENLDEKKILTATTALSELLALESLEGMRLLDIGCGSGLSSLAAHRLGATVHSFDFDAHSVQATLALKDRAAPESHRWSVEQGSILDRNFMNRLGKWDIVYSWGVLHHTGAMWDALENAGAAVAEGGRLAIAIYNDQGTTSRTWRRIKRWYVTYPALRPLLLAGSLVAIWGWTAVLDIKHLRPGATWRNYGKERGMSAWHDLVDWVGGYPFEVATPDAIFNFYHGHGYALERLITRQGRGCNEFLFLRSANPGK